MRKLIEWVQEHWLVCSFLAFCGLCWGGHELLNWQAERRWQHYQTEARARGVKLTLVEFALPEIPDEENFACLPMFRAAFAAGGSSAFDLPDAWPKRMPRFGDVLKGERMDWPAWQDYFRGLGWLADKSDDPVQDTLRALDHFAPELAEWREWHERHRSRFPLDLKAGAAMPLPHLSVIQHATRIFALRLRAHLARGESAAAYEDFRDGFQGYRALRDEPTLISELVRISVLALLSSAVGDGLREQAWSEADLQKIEAELASVRFWEDYRLALASERGFMNAIVNKLAEASPMDRHQMLAGFGSPIFAGALIPRGVLIDNLLRQNRFFDEMLARIDPTGHRLDYQRPTPSGPEYLHGAVESYYYFLLRICAPVYSSVEERVIRTKTQLDQTRLACALERYRLANGAFPEHLEQLAPSLIPEAPLDPYTDAAFKYSRREPGSFVLYSVGPNLLDDRAVLNPKKGERYQLDVVWLYAPPPAPAAPAVQP
ncbi:MAG: hypothetical protein QOE70_5209 [Chthoniobacter sp.]|jgi:hypothetical protein|nr:hypothetical protein [Chthoniobacter sp.]